MSLIDSDVLFRRLQEGKCIRTGQKLTSAEFGLSRSDFRHLYDGRIEEGEKRYLKQIVDCIISERGKIRSWGDSEQSKLKSMIELIFKSKPEFDESLLHVYLYLFWDQLCRQAQLKSYNGSCVYLGSGSVDEQDLTPDMRSVEFPFFSELVRNAKVDLAVINHDTSTLFLIDVKRDALDDRALGQMMRYYAHASRLAYRGRRTLPIDFIRPVLFLAKSDFSHMQYWPPYFNEIVGLFTYSFTDNGTVGFVNLRKRILSAALL